MKFNPGSSFGRPLSPRVLPCLLIKPIADLSCSELQFSQFASCTFGSADSKPNESTAPSDKVSMSVFVISSDSSRCSAIIEGLPLSVCKIPKRSSSLKPCSNLEDWLWIWSRIFHLDYTVCHVGVSISHSS